MKSFIKHNSHATDAIKISDSDNAKIFKDCNSAIKWLLSTQHAIDAPQPFNAEFFVAAFKASDDDCADNCEMLYQIFNFGSRAAIYIQEKERYEEGGWRIKSNRFLTDSDAKKMDK